MTPSKTEGVYEKLVIRHFFAWTLFFVSVGIGIGYYGYSINNPWISIFGMSIFSTSFVGIIFRIMSFDFFLRNELRKTIINKDFLITQDEQLLSKYLYEILEASIRQSGSSSQVFQKLLESRFIENLRVNELEELREKVIKKMHEGTTIPPELHSIITKPYLKRLYTPVRKNLKETFKFVEKDDNYVIFDCIVSYEVVNNASKPLPAFSDYLIHETQLISTRGAELPTNMEFCIKNREGEVIFEGTPSKKSERPQDLVTCKEFIEDEVKWLRVYCNKELEPGESIFVYRKDRNKAFLSDAFLYALTSFTDGVILEIDFPEQDFDIEFMRTIGYPYAQSIRNGCSINGWVEPETVFAVAFWRPKT